MEWILMVYLWGGYSPVITAVEFRNKSACVTAFNELRATQKGDAVRGVCVSKGVLGQ